jgi:uncharacterized phage infection (PIP) family protein YhgE
LNITNTKGEISLKATDIYNWQNNKYAAAYEPMRNVVSAYQEANRVYDTVQEWVLMDAGMPNTAQVMHNVAHKFPQRFDAFIEMLHEQHLRGEYPATNELTEPIESLDKAFEIVVSALDEIQDALTSFHAATDNASLKPMALFAENAMQENSATYTPLLEMWHMWDGTTDKVAYDKWAKKYIKG